MRRMLLFAFGLAIAALGVGAFADVLVARDGSVIRTKGAWKVKGRQVIFTSAKGVLSSMRLSEIDLEASGKATEAEKSPAPEIAASFEEPRKEASYSWTDADFGAAGALGGSAVTQSLLSGAVELELPSDFVEMSSSELATLFPTEWRPSVGYKNGEGSVVVAAKLSSARAASTDLPQLMQFLRALFAKMLPEVEWLQSEIVDRGGRDYIIFDYQVPMMGTTLRSEIAVTPYRGQTLLLTYVILGDDHGHWVPVAQSILRSAQINE